MIKKLFYVYLLFPAVALAGLRQLLPIPQIVTPNGQQYPLSASTLLTDIATVQLVPDLPQIPLNKDEAYILEVTRDKVRITAITALGVYRAHQTLQQLVVQKGKKRYIEGCTITDYPAFRVRGFMQDAGRSYLSVQELKTEIALLAQYKINVFHWHLTENEGWRLQSLRYPQLNAAENYERMPAQYYTLAEAKELVEFCRERHVLLIPEIDMPGHSRAFEKAFGTSMQTEAGISILKNLLDEVCETFSVPYIHIGTDEVAFTNPRFVPEMVQYLRDKGKKVISWNPGWKYQAGEIDMTQLWSYRGKAQKGIPAIDCRFHYLNHYDAFADLIALYNSRILNVEQGDDDHAGAIIAIWNDRYIANERDIIAQNNFYPAALALGERAWRGGGNAYFDGNGTMLPSSPDDPSFQQFADFEARMLWHKAHHFNHVPFAYVKQTDIEWAITEPFDNGGDLSKDFDWANAPTRKAYGASIYLRHTWGDLVPGFYPHPKPNSTAYAYTGVYSPKKQTVGLWVSFQNYSRSEKDIPPRIGHWDYKQSKIWLNGTEIAPPIWQSQHSTPSNEVPLTNENFEVRPPLRVTLNKGWNRVLLKLPIGSFSTPEVRLVKWHFTCVFVTLDGKERAGAMRVNN